MEKDRTSSREVQLDNEIQAEKYDDTRLNNANFMEVLNAEYALALSTGPQLKATDWRSIQLFLILSVAFMGSLTNGFDGSGRFRHDISDNCDVDGRLVMSAINGMSCVDLDLCNICVPNSLLLLRQYLQYFGIDGQDAGGGVGTTTAIIFGIVCHSSHSMMSYS